MMKAKATRTRRSAAGGPLRRPSADPAAAIRGTASVKIIKIAEALGRGASRVFGTRYDLKNTELRILGNLSEAAPITIGELSRRVRIDKAWISRSLTHLQYRKLVRLSSDPDMPRAKLIRLTRRGTLLLAKIAPVTVQRAQRLLTGIDPAQAEAILDRILLNVAAMEDEEAGLPR
jgi:DNA-binding MarR family transcriptional regulator